MMPTNEYLQPVESAAHGPLKGDITVPGDKSISHRALMLASQALGPTRITGLLTGEDVRATAAALRACGVVIREQADGDWWVEGVGIGGLEEPAAVLDMGNAGTAARLMMGLLAPGPHLAIFTGDASLSRRPMARVITPLTQMGAQFWSREGGRLPLALRGAGRAIPISYTLPVASAQVKSAILLAGLNTAGETTVIEPQPTRDHTERMLRFFDLPLVVAAMGDGVRITIAGQPPQRYAERSFHVPADPSSAAFALVAALIVPGSQVTVRHVCVNPLRAGLFSVLEHMGARLAFDNHREIGGEPVADITASASTLRGAEVSSALAPAMIDEYPILAVAAACAHGTTLMRGLQELRVKESDRLAAITDGLNACGVRALIEGDDLIVTGAGGSPAGGGEVVTHYDHRIAMSFYVLGLAAKRPVRIDDSRAVATSFPGFFPLMASLYA